MTSPPVPDISPSPHLQARSVLQELAVSTTDSLEELMGILPQLHAAALCTGGVNEQVAQRMLQHAEALHFHLLEATRLAESCKILYRNILQVHEGQVPALSPQERGDQSVRQRQV